MPTAGAEAPSAPQPTKQVKLRTTEDASDPLRDLRYKFVVGDVYYEKAVGALPMYRLLSLSAADGAKFERIVNGVLSGNVEKATIKKCSIQALSQLWVKRKTVMPSIVPAEKFYISKCDFMDLDVLKAKLYLKLTGIGKEADAKYEGMLGYGADPSQVSTLAAFSKGELQLPAVTVLSGIHPQIDCKETPLAFCDKKAFILKGSMPKIGADDVKEKDSNAPSAKKLFTVPFWWVAPTSTEEMANMAVQFQSFTGASGSNYKVAFYVNTCALKVGDKLQFYKPKASVELPAEQGEEEGQSGQPPKQRKAKK